MIEYFPPREEGNPGKLILVEKLAEDFAAQLKQSEEARKTLIQTIADELNEWAKEE